MNCKTTVKKTYCSEKNGKSDTVKIESFPFLDLFLINILVFT